MQNIFFFFFSSSSGQKAVDSDVDLRCHLLLCTCGDKNPESHPHLALLFSPYRSSSLFLSLAETTAKP